jgi:hypothetical protein
MKHLYILFLWILAGCTAQVVSQPGGISRSRYAPINETSRSGMVKYLNQGAKGIIEARREDAYRKMYNSCNGNYEIVKEGPNSEGGIGTNVSGTLYLSESQYWYIEYRCISQEVTNKSGFIAEPWKPKVESKSWVFCDVTNNPSPGIELRSSLLILSPILVDFDFVGARITLSGVVQNASDETIEDVSIAFSAIGRLGNSLTDTILSLGDVNAASTKTLTAVLVGVNDYRDKATYADLVEFNISSMGSLLIAGEVKVSRD